MSKLGICAGNSVILNQEVVVFSHPMFFEDMEEIIF
jgi:hypothetical protein